MVNSFKTVQNILGASVVDKIHRVERLVEEEIVAIKTLKKRRVEKDTRR